MAERGANVRAIMRVRAARRELLRRAVLEGDPATGVILLARQVLGYEVLPFHVELIRHQQASRENLGLAPRGYGKSTIRTIARAIFEVLRDPDIRILIVSKTALQAEVFLREIKQHLEANQELISTFGYQVGEKWDLREVNVAGRRAGWKESTITTLGVGGPVASRHYDLILADDLVDEKNSRTELQREQVRTWYFKTLYPTVVDETSRVWMTGTRFHPGDLWGVLEKDPAVDVLRIRALERGPDETWLTPWPEKFTVERLLELQRRMGSAIFASQYQNDVELMRGSIFRPTWFRYYDRPPDRWERCDTWIGCDPAATKREVLLTGTKADTDWWTICAVSRVLQDDGSYEPEFFVRYLWRGRVTKAEYVARVRRLYEELGAQSVHVEANAAQEYLAQDLEGVVPVRRVTRTTDKVSRAYRLQPFFENGQVLFPSVSARGQLSSDGWEDVWAAAEDELALFPDADHDDLFDAIETAVSASLSRVQVFVA